MLFNQLTVTPTPESLEYLSMIFGASALDLDIDTWNVQIINTQYELEAEPAVVYTAIPTHFKVWYDSSIQTSSLIMSLDSPQLQHRYDQLVQSGVQDAFYQNYNPHIVIKRYMPALSQHYRRFILGMANSFGAREQPLYFTNEVAHPVNLEFPPEFDYNTAMDEERVNGRFN